jgi:hypothetical protein
MGVRPLTALIIARGPGVTDDGRFDADLLRRRGFVLVNEARIETFWCIDLLRDPNSDPDVTSPVR